SPGCIPPRHEVLGLVGALALLWVAVRVGEHARQHPEPPVLDLRAPGLQREERHPLGELPAADPRQELSYGHAKRQRQSEDEAPRGVLPQFPASSSTSSGRKPDRRCATSNTRFRAAALLRPSASTPSSLNSLSPPSSTTVRATSLARMLRRFMRLFLPRVSTMDCSNWSRSAPVRPRT